MEDETKEELNTQFLAYIDTASPAYDEKRAKIFGLHNWAILTFENQRLWDHCFGRENRLPQRVTKNLQEPAWVLRKMDEFEAQNFA